MTDLIKKKKVKMSSQNRIDFGVHSAERIQIAVKLARSNVKFASIELISDYYFHPHREPYTRSRNTHNTHIHRNLLYVDKQHIFIVRHF